MKPLDQCPLQLAAQEAPEHFALLGQKADEFSLQLSRLNIQPGDRIAASHPPCYDLIALFFAAWRLGASICPLNPRLPSVHTHLERLSPKLFITSFPIHATPQPSIPSLPRSLFLFTSGSTGTPKIAILTLESLLLNAQSSIPLQPSDRYLLSLPLFHVGGIGIMLRCILARAAITLNADDPAITHISCVPTQLYRASPVYKNLKCVLLGGAPIDSYNPRLPVYATYGLTEMGSMVLTHKAPLFQNFLGHPLPHREISLLHDGEICVRGKTLFQGYWEKGSINIPLNDGWFATGDIGRYDPQHGFAILGRKDWQFISGGENIQPEEIEQHLLQMPGILEAVITPKPDPEFGQRPVACVQTNDATLTLQKVQDFLRAILPKYKIPVALFLFDELPKIGLKIDRNKINKSLFIHS